MSVTHEVVIWCDDCGHWVRGINGLRHLRLELHEKGWKHSGKKDYCPNCVQKHWDKEKQEAPPAKDKPADEPCDCMDCSIAGEPTH